MSVEKGTTTGRIHKTKFASVPEWVAAHPHILSHPTALSTYVQLFLLGDFKSRITTSDWREITQATGWSKPTVMRAMKVLREAGAAVREGDDVRLPMDNPSGIKCETLPVSHLIPESLTCETAPYTESNSEKDTDSNESDARSEEIPPPSKPAKKRATENAYTDIELAIWNAYPRTRNRNKAATIRRVRYWVGRDESEDAMLSAATAFAVEMADTEPQWIKHGETFFGPDKIWEDYVTTGAATAAWTPDPEARRRAEMYDEFYETQQWTDDEGEVHKNGPELSEIMPPSHPEGGHMDRFGRKFKWNSRDRRVYEDGGQNVTIGAQGFAGGTLPTRSDESATSSNSALRSTLSVQKENQLV